MPTQTIGRKQSLSEIMLEEYGPPPAAKPRTNSGAMPSSSAPKQSLSEIMLEEYGPPPKPNKQVTGQNKGMLQGAADTINKAYESYKNAPVIKQTRQAIGGAVATGGAAIGGIVGAIGNPIANTIEGKPLFQGFAKDVKETALSTARFGRQIGEEGAAAAPLGLAGKAVNVPLAFAQGYQGASDVQEGMKNKNTEQAVMGGIGLATSALGLKSSIDGKGLLLNQGPKQAVTNRFPITKPVLAPVQTAVDVAENVVKPLAAKAADMPLVQNAKGAVKDVMTGRTWEKMSGAEDQLLNTLDPSALVPKVDKTGQPIKEGLLSPFLQQTRQKRFEEYKKIADKAMKDSRNPTPLEIAGKRAGDALEQYQQKLNKWGDIKKQELSSIGDRTMEVAPTTERLRNDLRGSLGVEAGIAPDGTLVLADAPGRRSKVALDSADQGLLKTVVSEMDRLGDSNSVIMIDDTIDALQDLLYKRKQNVAIPVNSQVERIIKKAVGELNAKLKSTAGERYRKANDKYAYFIDTYQKLNKALGQDESKAAALAKRVFSPSDGGTRALFNQVLRDTGIDLHSEAQLAKGAMDYVGDTRQTSILGQLGKVAGDASPTMPGMGLLQNFLKLGVSQLTDKNKIIDRAAQGKRGLRREDL